MSPLLKGEGPQVQGDFVSAIAAISRVSVPLCTINNSVEPSLYSLYSCSNILRRALRFSDSLVQTRASDPRLLFNHRTLLRALS